MSLKNFLLQSSNKDNIVTILDIGSSKIICLIAKIKAGKINIIGHGCHSSNGFNNGNITDPRLAKTSIIAAVDQAEKSSSINIDTVILALNGNKIRSHYLTPSISLKKQKVTDRDVENLILQGIKELEIHDHEVIHYFPLDYILDGNQDIKEPCGLLGKQLTAKMHYVTASSLMLDNIINCLASCQLNVEDCIFSPYAAGLATLNSNEQEVGSTIIDLGSGITSYALFSQNNMVYSGFIPIGSMSITNDIAKSFMLDLSTAERLKTIHGAASVNYADTQKMINYKTDQTFDNEERSISNAELNEVINARLDEIINIIKPLLNKQYKLYPNARHSIVLTGGGSMLSGTRDEVSKILGTKARLGKPVAVEGLNPDLINATYSSAVGVLQYISKHYEIIKNSDPTKHSLSKKLTGWIKDNF